MKNIKKDIKLVNKNKKKERKKMIKEKWFTLDQGLAGTYQGLARRVPGFIDSGKKVLLYSVRRWILGGSHSTLI